MPPFTHRGESAITLTAGAAALAFALTGCGAVQESVSENASAPAATGETQQTQQTQQSPTEETASPSDAASNSASVSGSATPTDSESQQDESPEDEPGDTSVTKVHFAPGINDAQGKVGADTLANNLEGKLDGAEVTCESELDRIKDDKNPVTCSAKSDSQNTQWKAYFATTPNSPKGAGQGDAVLYVSNPGMESEAIEALTSTATTGAGLAGHYGGEEGKVDQAQLEEDTLKVLKMEDAKGSAASMQDQHGEWQNVTCNGGLDMNKAKVTHCEATMASGDNWKLQVVPARFSNDNEGILIAIGSPRDV